MLTLILSLSQNNSQELEVSDPRQPLASIQGTTAYIERGPIKIYNNSAFSSYSSSGTGTSNDPYLIEGYNITFNSGTLIHIEDTTAFFKISNCYLNGSMTAPIGVYLENVTHGTLENNIICNIDLQNVYLKYSNTTSISNNTIYDCDQMGIYLDNSLNNTLMDNTIYNVSEDGILLINADNNTVLGNIVYNCATGGIYLSDSDNNSLLGNFVYNCTYDGIELDGNCDFNTFWGNTIYNCLGYGLLIIDNCHNNTVRYNVIYNNTDYGLYIVGSAENNTMNHNNFVNNGVTATSQASDQTAPQQNNNISYNYWNDHTSPDGPPADGIVDTPYDIDDGINQDPFPLASPVLPKVTIESPAEQAYCTDTITVEFSGYASQYSYYIEGIDSENQTWTTKVDRTLADGAYTLHVYGSDIVGHTKHVSVTFTIDASAPTITLESPSNATVHSSGTVIDVKVTDAHLDTVLYNWVGTTNQTWSGDYETSLPTEETQHSLHVYANDSFGRWGSKLFLFTTDDTPPTIVLNSPTNDTTHAAGITINLTVTDLHLETVLYNWDGRTNQTLLAPYNLTLPSDAGLHVLRVCAKDAAGHWTSQVYVFRTQRPVDLGFMIGAGVIVTGVAALAGGSYYLLGRKPPKPP